MYAAIMRSLSMVRGVQEKTSVLVNLKEYLQQDHKDLLKDIHILKPVDPTLLEDNESFSPYHCRCTPV